MNDVKAPINLEVFQGHIVLLCKGWYKIPSKTTFFEALRMLLTLYMLRYRQHGQTQ